MATVAAAPHAAHHSSRPEEPSEEDDELMFGDFCFTCGNATQGTPYCSQQCRHSDSLNPLPSPDFSPALSAVPPLISSAKSVSSTPPSSVNNSPSPFTTPLSAEAAGEDPPPLDLPALASKFDYGGASLPVGLRYPTHFSHSFSLDLVSYPSKELKAASFVAGGGFDPLDLTYRRKPGVPTQTIPAPLYFRQTAAVHSSPALGPSSPKFSPRFSPSHGPTLSNLTNVSTFALPPAITTVSAPPTLPPTPDCGRPGCAGRSELRAGARSRPTSLSATKRPAALDADLLLSPRIRALRGSEVASIGAEEGATEGEPVDGNHHSAFACYLFSHLSEPTPPLPSTDSSRGRSIHTSAAPSDEKRSLSADSAFTGRGPSKSATHPPRFAFGGRARRAPERLEPTLEFSSTPAQAKLTPGRFIAATTDSPTPSTYTSPMPSPPASPPTLANRGRPSTRRTDASPPAFVGPTPDPRGRSKLRGIGAVQRDFSPVRDPSNSSSRGRTTDVSRERARGSKSRARSPRPSSRRSEREEPVREESRRGRARREEIEEEGEEMYRRGRSTSALRRGRGREVALSGAGYGHYESP